MWSDTTNPSEASGSGSNQMLDLGFKPPHKSCLKSLLSDCCEHTRVARFDCNHSS